MQKSRTFRLENLKTITELDISTKNSISINEKKNHFLAEFEKEFPVIPVNNSKNIHKFINEQISLSAHMKGIKNELKKEFMEIQVQKQFEKNQKKSATSSISTSLFQARIEKNKALDNFLGLNGDDKVPSMKLQLLPKKSNNNKTKLFTSPTLKRKMSLNSGILSPPTSDIVAHVRIKNIFPANYSKKEAIVNSSVLKNDPIYTKKAEDSSFFKNKSETKRTMELKKQKKHKGNFEKIKKERNKTYNSIVRNIENRQKTFARFGFKTNEKEECQYLKPILEIFWGNEPKGTMMVADLWGEKSMRGYLGSCKLTKDKLMLAKIASIRQKKSDFLKGSKKLFENAFGFQENKNKLQESIKKQQSQLINRFKKFIEVEPILHEKHGVIKQLSLSSLNDMKTPNNGTQNLLKDIFLNAFPGIYAKKKMQDIWSSNTEDTKAMTEERSLYSTINPVFKSLKNK